MNRKEAEDYIYKSYLRAERFQCYDSKDAQKRNPSLSKAIIDSLNHTPCISVTGSKGKGSVANMISQILQTQYCVGLMTSPHIETFNERFRVNNIPISDTDFVDVVEKLKDSFDSIEFTLSDNVCISPMGIQAAIGLMYFNSQNTSYNVFELGKGAKYDDVNNIENTYSVINTVFLEHTRELGDTVEKIAEDKSWIIKKNQLGVYVANQQPSVLGIIEKRADAQNVPVKKYGRDFSAANIRFSKQGMIFDVFIGKEKYSDLCVPLLGEHQARNCALSMAICRDIVSNWQIDQIREKLVHIEWPGRMEIISQTPLTLLDACINRESTGNIKKVLSHLCIEKCVFIVGIPDDKDYRGVICSIQDVAKVTILTKSSNPHYHFSRSQQKALRNIGIDTIESQSVNEAIDIALKYNSPIAILGTTSIIADVKRLQHNSL